MTLTLSMCHAWGNPTLTLHSVGLIARTASVSVLPLCARGQLSFLWCPLRSHLAAGWKSPFFPEVHTSLQYYGTPPLVSHPSFCFSCSHIRWRHWRKRIRAPASSGWVCVCTSISTHSYWMEGEGEPSVQAVQSHICTRWMRLLTGFSASLNGFAPGLQAKMFANEEAGLIHLYTLRPPLHSKKWVVFSTWWPRLRPGHLRCVSGSFISAGDAG